MAEAPKRTRLRRLVAVAGTVFAVLGGLVVLVLLVTLGFVVWLGTPGGNRFLTGQVVARTQNVMSEGTLQVGNIDTDLFGRTRLEPPGFKVGRGFQPQPGNAVMAKHPYLTAFQGHRDGAAAHIQSGVNLRMQVKADIKVNALHPETLHDLVIAAAIDAGHGAQRILAG